MTILQALTAAIQVPGVDDLTLEKACIDASLNPSDAYQNSIEKDVDVAAVGVLRSLIVTSEKEGGYSYTISTEALSNRIDFLLNKWDLNDQKFSNSPSVRAVNIW